MLRWRGGLVVAVVLAAVAGCSRPKRPVLEPEDTITRTWVDTVPPQRADSSAAPEAAPASDDGAEPPPATPPPSGSRRPWAKAKAWSR
jgi:hypothetical protein